MKFSNVKTLIFIGGGDLMLATMLVAREKGFLVGAVLAPRHADEIVESGDTLIVAIEKKKFPVCVEKSGADIDPTKLGEAFANALAICFGPAWIFPNAVLDRFPKGMVNFNGIPIPHYLGGAHYTWQILNDYRCGGCHIQYITDDVDRGDLLMSETFELSENALIPDDYFRENQAFANGFLGSFLDKLVAGAEFDRRPFEDVNDDRLYYPRLITTENGWIDWSWSGKQIDAFCRAFGSPYKGASTFYNGRRIFLKQVKFVTDSTHADFHPFCFGLIVRCTTKSAYVAVKGGLLQIDAYEFDASEDTNSKLREGNRFYTDTQKLEQSRIYRPQISSNGEVGS